MLPRSAGRAVQADVSEAEDAQRLVEEAGDVDILVNNAGITRDGLLARMPDEDWRVVLDTNLGGTFNTCRAAARGMMRTARRLDRERLQHRRRSTAIPARPTTLPRRPGSSASRRRSRASSAAAACARTSWRRATSRPG